MAANVRIAGSWCRVLPASGASLRAPARVADGTLVRTLREYTRSGSDFNALFPLLDLSRSGRAVMTILE
jgi:hypothetical protein